MSDTAYVQDFIRCHFPFLCRFPKVVLRIAARYIQFAICSTGILLFSHSANAFNAYFQVTPEPSAGHYTLTWDPPLGRTYLQERFNGGSWSNIGGVSPSSPRNFTNKAAGTYEYRLRWDYQDCSGGGGRGGCDWVTEYSSIKSVSVASPASPVTQVISLDGSFDISWPSHPLATTYTLQEKVGAGAWTQVHSGSALSKAFSGKSVGTYQYRYKVCGPSDPCPYSAVADMAVETATNLAVEPGFATGSSIIAGALPHRTSVDQRGNALISIPLRLLRGINGTAPSLAIEFSSGASPALTEDKRTEGVLGYGWQLSGVPEIRRCRVGLDNDDIKYDSTDRLCLNGNALIKVSGSSYWADNAEYRTEIETFAKVEANGSGLANRSFDVTHANGHIARFGTNDESRLVAPGESDPYVWSPTSYRDNFGNSITYTWHELASVGTNYLRFIDYSDARIEFWYEDRCKSLTNCDTAKVQNTESVSGIKVQAVVLNRIRLRMNNDKVGDYRLDNNYVNGYLRLEGLQYCGNNEAGTAAKCLMPVSFAWDTLTIGESGTTETSDLLVVDEFTNSYGDKTLFDYAVIDGYSTFQHALHVAKHPEYPSKPLPGTVGTGTKQRALVQYLKTPDGTGGVATTEYKYQDYPLYSTEGRGYLGFAATYSEFYDQTQFNASTTSSFEGHRRHYRQFRYDFPYVGYLGREIVEVDTNPGAGETWTRIRKGYHRYASKATHSGVTYPYLSIQMTDNPERQSGGTMGYGSATHVLRSYCWKTLDTSGACPTTGSDHDYPTQETVRTSTGLYISGADNVSTHWGEVYLGVGLSGSTQVQQQVKDFSNISSSWLNGFVERSENGWGASSITDTIEVEYARDASSNNKPGVIQYFGSDPDYDRTISLTYDSFGNVTNTNDTGIDQVTASTSSSSFLENRYAQSVTNAKGHTSSLGYDLRFGSVDSVTDPNGDVTTTTRDELGRVVSSTGPDGTTLSVVYEPCTTGCSAVTWATPRLKVTRTATNNGVQVAPEEVSYLDTRGLLVLSEVEAFSASDGWARTQYHYDAEGRLVAQSLPYFSAGGVAKLVETFHDHKGRVVYVDRANGEAIEYDIYADSGSGGHVNVEVTETGEQRTKRYRYNRLGQLAETTDAYGTSSAVTTAYTYTLRGDLDTVTVDGVEVADIDYDNAGNRTSLVEPNTGTTTFEYYSNHLLKQSTDANADKTRYQYDALQRLEQRIDGYLGTSPVTNTWTWDTAANGKGRLASRSNGSAFTETYTYDGYGRLDTVSADVNVTGFTDNSAYVLDYGYDSYGRVTTLAYPNLTVTNVYNSRGYLEQVKKGSTVLHQFNDADAFGNVVDESYANGLKTTRGYDSETGELESINTGTTSLPTSIQDLVFEWQSDSALYRRIDKRGTATASDDLIETFGYDDMGRLQSAATGLGGRDLAFSYDDHGNLESKTSDISGDLDVTAYSYTTTGKPHRLNTVSIGGLSNTLSYDSAGNITQYNAASGDDTFLDYDDAGRVTKITVGSSSTDTTPTARDEFWYGPDGQRFLRKATWNDSGTQKTSWTFYMLGGVFEEVRPEHDSTVDYRQRVLVTGSVQHTYVKNPSSSSSYPIYLHRDHLGNIAMITNVAANVSQNVDFDPFGRQRGTLWDRDATQAEINAYAIREDTLTARGFTDHEMLNRTGFVHMNGRVYDPRLGRFVQADPVIGRPTLSQNYNRYAYGFNSPLSGTDPTGLDWDDFGSSFGISVFFPDYTSKNYDSGPFGLVAGNASTPGYDVPGALLNVWDFYSCNFVGLCGGGLPGGIGGFGGWGGTSVPGYAGNYALAWNGEQIFETGRDVAEGGFRIFVFDYEQPLGGSYVLEAITLIPVFKPLKLVKLRRIENAVNSVDDILEATARGRASEVRVLDDLGLDKNNRRVSTAEGSSVPDALTTKLSVEIKDCITVSCTRQVRIQTGAAQASGRESVLVTGKKTHVTEPAENAFDRIIRRDDLGPQ